MYEEKTRGIVLNMNTKKISFATGSRADYGIVRRYLKYLNSDKSIDLSILVTGALLSEEFGHQVDLIYKDGFRIAAEIDIDIDPRDNEKVIHSMALALDKFGKYFFENQSDLLIILGDRYEMLSVATAAAMNQIPILHIHGGEATFGNYDEFIRHSITKMSTFHFTATEEYRNRVIQLGENPDAVFNLGALGAENCLHIDEADIDDELRRIVKQEYCVVLFHPETLTHVSVEKQVDEMLNAIDNINEYHYVFLGSNADTNSNVIRQKVKEFVAKRDNCIYYENLSTAKYHYLVKNSKALIGNSSSGLIEAPSLGAYTINIGDRQAGRTRGNSVLDVRCDKNEIMEAIRKVIMFREKETIYNPYFKKNTALNYYSQTMKIMEVLSEQEFASPKTFYDICAK